MLLLERAEHESAPVNAVIVLWLSRLRSRPPVWVIFTYGSITQWWREWTFSYGPLLFFTWPRRKQWLLTLNINQYVRPITVGKAPRIPRPPNFLLGHNYFSSFQDLGRIRNAVWSRRSWAVSSQITRDSIVNCSPLLAHEAFPTPAEGSRNKISGVRTVSGGYVLILHFCPDSYSASVHFRCVCTSKTMLFVKNYQT